jgi:hypothetical protein
VCGSFTKTGDKKMKTFRIVTRVEKLNGITFDIDIIREFNSHFDALIEAFKIEEDIQRGEARRRLSYIQLVPD